MGIRIHVAPRPDALVAMLCDQLATPLADPFASELVAVPSRGIERWLTQQIASGLAERGAGEGICANVEFPSPRRLVGRVMEAVPDLAGAAAAWEGPALTAHLIDTIDGNLGAAWMRLLARYLDDESGGSSANRLAAAAKMARLFSRYARRRPAMIRAWRKGDDVGPDGAALSDEFRWQARLWRSLRERIGTPALPELLPSALEPVRRGEAAVDLPERLSVYGLTSTDPLDLQVLVALAGHRHVSLYVLHPSPALWQDVEATLTPAVLPERIHDPTTHLAFHPLLEAWGRDSRELQTVLATNGLTGPPMDRATDADTLLGRLQSDLYANQGPETDETLGADMDSGRDRSIQVHVCHGARRQAEVLRDAILHLLADRPDLEPRDVVIMTPDLATFAPLLEAAFPQSEGGDLPDLRLRIADRSPAARNPLVGFTSGLLEAAGSRLEAAVVRELVDRPLVQNKFGFDSDTAGSIVSLVDDSHIAWGLDQAHRCEWGVGRPERTWRRGLDRTLVGVFYADDPVVTVGGVSPLEGVEGQEAVPAGILAAILDRLVAIRELVCRPRRLSEWAGRIAEAVRMLATPAWGDEWQLDQLERLLAETFPVPEPGAADPEVTLGEVRQAIAAWTQDRPSPLHFRTGDITVCTLVPMRSVPYRVVALLGMDEARFPRQGPFDGDDLLADHELMGDSDAGGRDRQLLLDAILAAGDHLVVTYSGGDEITNARIPPAVPVAELCDTLEEMVGPEAMKKVVTRHPLQSFSEANFRVDALGVPGPWGFDIAPFQGAVAIQERRLDREPRRVQWPSPPDEETIRLKNLVEFLQSPVGRFVKARMGFTIPEPGGIPDDTIPTDLGGLGRWSVTDRLLAGLISGHDPDGLLRRERGSDALPPGTLGDDDLQGALEGATTLWQAARQHGYDPRRHRPYAGAVTTPEATVEGTVNADPEQGHVATVTPSRLKGRQRIGAWVRMVFLSALHPEVAWKAVLLGRREKSDNHVSVVIGPIKGDRDARHDTAIELLADLVELYREGHRRPLPIPCETAYAWQRAGGVDGDQAWRPAKDEFESRHGGSRDAAHLLVLPEITHFRALENSEFVDLAARLWRPILSMSVERRL